MNNIKLTEDDIKNRYISPAIEKSAWKEESYFMEYFFTDGQVIVNGKIELQEQADISPIIIARMSKSEAVSLKIQV